MERRKCLTTTGIILSSPLVGCLDTEPTTGEDNDNGQNNDDDDTDRDDGDDDTDNGREEFSLRIYNRIDEEVAFTVEAVSDGNELVSDTFTVEAETVEEIGTVPEEQTKLAVEATENVEDRTTDETVDLTEEDQLEAVEIQLQDGVNLRINPVYYDTPA